ATDVTSKGATVEFGISGGNIIGYVDADNNNQLTAGDRLVFQLTPNGNDFTFTLLDQIDHLPNTPANDDSQSLALDVSGAFMATDTDGDSVVLATAVTVNVEDDIPTNNNATPISVSVQEDALNNFDGSVVGDNIEGSTGNNEGGKTTTAAITAAALAAQVSVGA